jgi:polyisoprenoid-binding protein YceI
MQKHQPRWQLSAFALSVALSAPALAADYELDLSHSFIQFRISHLGYSVLNGRFNDFAGSLKWDKAAPADSSIALTIKTTSIDTNWAERDKHLRSADFLDVEKFPEASFKSTKFTGDATAGKLEGELTLHGVTKPIVLEVKAVGEGADPWGGYRAGFEGTTTLKRADFGISYDLGPASGTMSFDLFVEGIRKK